MDGDKLYLGSLTRHGGVVENWIAVYLPETAYQTVGRLKAWAANPELSFTTQDCLAMAAEMVKPNLPEFGQGPAGEVVVRIAE